MKKFVLLCLLTVSLPASIFANDRILTNPSQPYDSLGVVELKVTNQHTFLKFITFGVMRKRSYQRMTHELDKKLLGEASKKFGADAIANVTYWPGSGSEEPVKFLYGRAEMIRFKKFPAIAAAPESHPLNASQG